MTAIKVGNEGTADNSENISAVADAVEKIFRAAEEHKMEQDTVRAALDSISKIAQISGINISGSIFRGDRVVHMEESDDE